MSLALATPVAAIRTKPDPTLDELQILLAHLIAEMPDAFAGQRASSGLFINRHPAKPASLAFNRLYRDFIGATIRRNLQRQVDLK